MPKTETDTLARDARARTHPAASAHLFDKSPDDHQTSQGPNLKRRTYPTVHAIGHRRPSGDKKTEASLPRYPANVENGSAKGD